MGLSNYIVSVCAHKTDIEVLLYSFIYKAPLRLMWRTQQALLSLSTSLSSVFIVFIIVLFKKYKFLSQVKQLKTLYLDWEFCGVL